MAAVENLIASHMDELKQVSLKVFGLVPYAGSFIQLFVTVMWPKDNKSVWDDIKGQMEQLVTEKIDKERAVAIQTEFEALSSSVQTYRDTTGERQKSQWFTTILGKCESLHKLCTKEATRAPQNIVPLYAAFGTMELAIYREQCLFYKQIYGIEDPDAALHFQVLQTKQKELLDALDTLKKKCIDNRKGFITWEKGGRAEYVIDKKVEGYKWEYNKEYKQDVADAAIAQRKVWCENSYGLYLDKLLGACKTWQFADMLGPNQPKYLPTTQVVRRTGPYGSSKPKQTKFDDEAFWKAHGDITKIVIYEGDRLDGIEVFYGGVSSGIRGKAAGNGLTMDMDINKGERCVRAAGLAGIGGGTVSNIALLREVPARPKNNQTLGWIQRSKRDTDTTDEDINKRYFDQWRYPGAEQNAPIQPKETVDYIDMSTNFFNQHPGGGKYADSPFAFSDPAPLDENPHWYDGTFSFGDRAGGLDVVDGKTVPAPTTLYDENNPTDWIAREGIDAENHFYATWTLKKNRPTRRLAYIYGEESKNRGVEMIGFAWAYQELKRP